MCSRRLPVRRTLLVLAALCVLGLTLCPVGQNSLIWSELDEDNIVVGDGVLLFVPDGWAVVHGLSVLSLNLTDNATTVVLHGRSLRGHGHSAHGHHTSRGYHLLRRRGTPVTGTACGVDTRCERA